MSQTRQGVARERLRKRTFQRGAVVSDRLVEPPFPACLLTLHIIPQRRRYTFGFFLALCGTAQPLLDSHRPDVQGGRRIWSRAGLVQEISCMVRLFLTRRNPH